MFVPLKIRRGEILLAAIDFVGRLRHKLVCFSLYFLSQARLPGINEVVAVRSFCLSLPVAEEHTCYFVLRILLPLLRFWILVLSSVQPRLELLFQFSGWRTPSTVPPYTYIARNTCRNIIFALLHPSFSTLFPVMLRQYSPPHVICLSCSYMGWSFDLVKRGGDQRFDRVQILVFACLLWERMACSVPRRIKYALLPSVSHRYGNPSFRDIETFQFAC